MRFSTITLALSLAYLGATQDVDDNDIPSQCRSVCQSVVSLTNTCDRQHENDRAYLNCVCTNSDASITVPLCEACVAQYDNDGHDNDVNDLVRSCSFTTTTYTGQSAAATGVSQSATATTNSGGLTVITGTASSGSGSATSAPTTTNGLTTSTRTTGTAASAQSTGAAPIADVSKIGGVAAVVLAMLGAM